MTSYTYATLVKKAKTCQANVKKEYKLGMSYRWSYYFAKSILSPGKDIKKITIADCKNPTGTSISAKVSKANYKDIATRYVNYIEKNKKFPNFAKYGKYQLRPKLLCVFFANILVSYSANKTLPASMTIKSSCFTNPNKKHGHATSHGCDNMGQNNGYYCGCHSLQEVFRNLTGKVVPQSTIASVAGTTSSGTDHSGLNTAVAWFNKKYGFNLKVEWKNFSDLGWSGIKKIVNSSNQDCVIHNCYRKKWGHYEVINGVSDSNIKVQNSLGDKCSDSCYCGYVEDRTPPTFRSYISGISQKSVMVITKT